MPREGGLLEESLTGSVLGAFFEVYNALGYGFLEHVYVAALERELRTADTRSAVRWGCVSPTKGKIASQRLEMVVDEKLVLEIKTTYHHPKAARRQLFQLPPRESPRGRSAPPFRSRTEGLPVDL